MSNNNGNNTPGGTPMEVLVNPPSNEAGPMDSGEGQLLHSLTGSSTPRNPFERVSKISRSPERSSQKSYTDQARKTQQNSVTTAVLQQKGNNHLFVQENCSSTENERKLYKEWQKVTNEKNQQSLIIVNLQQQIDELKKEIMLMKQPESTPQQAKVNSHGEYCTDEEDLARETEWIRVKHKRNKKRKLNNTPSPPLKPQAVQAKPQQDEKKNKKIPPPPPIIVDGIKNYHDFYDIIKQSISDQPFTTKLMNEYKIKINVNSGDAYRSIVKTLSNGSFIFHSYENKQERPIRVMAKNLHHTCSIERIKDELTSKNLKVDDVLNKISWKTKRPLDMFILSFSCEEDISRIHGITSILGCKVEIEPLRKSKIVPQCKRCQSYGHTQKYCGKQPRCVKCAGHHLSVECVNPKEAQPKCVHCGEPHPASYRGCMIAKEIQKIKNKNMNKTHLNNGQTINNERQAKQKQKSTVFQLRNEEVTYAQTAAGASIKPKENRKDVDINQTLQAILTKLTSFDERLQKLEDRAMGAKPKPKQK